MFFWRYRSASDPQKARPTGVGWLSIVLGVAAGMTLLIPGFLLVGGVLALVAVVLGCVAVVGHLSDASAWIGIAVGIAAIVAFGLIVAALLEYTASTS